MELDILVWNVKSGGFSSYEPSLARPERETHIQSLLRRFHSHGIDSTTLTDTYRWDELYQGEEGIAAHLGYRAARFTRLNDERLNRKNGEGIGITFATDQPIEESQTLDLETRQALRIILGIGKYGLQIASVYLDDINEDVRIKQIRALTAGLEPDMPTILTGDFNALRPTMKDASFNTKVRDLAVRSLACMLPRKSALTQTIREMNRREVLPLLESFGFQDADITKKRPTAPARLPIFGIDYVLHNNQVSIEDVQIVPIQNASDHRPIIVSTTLPE